MHSSLGKRIFKVTKCLVAITTKTKVFKTYFLQAKPGQDVEQQLLDIEECLDNTMTKMRKNLMVIRLLGLLSEDENLHEDLMSRSAKMLEFLGSSIKRGAILQKSGSEAKVLALQSVNMVLSILSVHLTQRNVRYVNWHVCMLHQQSCVTVQYCK